MNLLPIDTVINKITMTSEARIRGLHRALQEIHNNEIAGDIAECGVWRGGNIIIARTALDSVQDLRQYWAYDTFSGMTAPTAEDPPEAHANWKFNPIINCLSPRREVENNFRQYQMLDDRIRIVQGPVEQTLLVDANLPDTIALLRLDTDWYSSTRCELEQLYPRLVPGGILIIDDYGFWSGCRRAVDEFFGTGFVQNNFEILDDTGIMYKRP